MEVWARHTAVYGVWHDFMTSMVSFSTLITAPLLYIPPFKSPWSVRPVVASDSDLCSLTATVKGQNTPQKEEKAQHTKKKENKPRRGKTNRRKGEASADGEKKKKDVSLIRCCPCCCCPCFGSVCPVCTVSVRISQSSHHQGFPHSLFQTSGAADVSRVPGKEG